MRPNRKNSTTRGEKGRGKGSRPRPNAGKTEVGAGQRKEAGEIQKDCT